MSRTTGCGTLSQQLKWQAACCRPEDSRIILSAFSSFFIVLSFLPFVLPLFILLYLVYFFPSLFPFLIFLVFHLSIFPPFIPPHLFDLFTSFLPNFTLFSSSFSSFLFFLLTPSSPTFLIHLILSLLIPFILRSFILPQTRLRFFHGYQLLHWVSWRCPKT